MTDTLPVWRLRPQAPGLYLCIGKDNLAGQMQGFDLTAEDIAKGAPFYTAAVYGPIPERTDETLVLYESEHYGQITGEDILGLLGESDGRHG